MLQMRSLAGAAVAAVMIVAPADARDPAREANYRQAQAAFDGMKPDIKVYFQVLLTTAGYWVNVPTQRFGTKLFDAVRSVQADSGLTATGILDTATVDAIVARAKTVWSRWGMRDIAHPSRGIRILVPAGLDLFVVKNNDNEIVIRDTKGRFLMEYFYLPAATLDMAWQSAQEVYKPTEISYKVKRDDFIVVNGRVGNQFHYERFQRDPQSPGGTGVIGFSLNWSVTDTDLMGDRLSTVISGRLAGEMSGQPTWRADLTILPVRPSTSQVAAAPVAPVPQTPAPPVSPPAPAPVVTPDPTPKSPRKSSGTGYYVSGDGHLVTNEHVVSGCTQVTVKSPEGPIPGRVLAQDRKNDLALVQIARNPSTVARFRTGVRLGESVAAYGYPLTGYLSQNGNFTIGNVSALAGLDDDTRELQISTPVQPGNSGGPLLDERGAVVGTIVSKLNALTIAASQVKDIPQNVNFALKTSVVLAFLESNGINPQLASVPSPDPVLAPADLADRARGISVNVQCVRE